MDIASDMLDVRDATTVSQLILEQLRGTTDATHLDIATVSANVKGLEAMMKGITQQFAGGGARGAGDAELMRSLLEALQVRY